jgi:hypothetical protein
VASQGAFQDGPLAIVFDDCYSRMFDTKARRDSLDKAIIELAATPPYLDSSSGSSASAVSPL